MGARKITAGSLLLSGLLLAVTGCGSSSSAPTASINATKHDQDAPKGDPQVSKPVQLQGKQGAIKRSPAELHPQVILHTSAGDIRLRLDAEKAPVTVGNFLENYVKRDFYNNTIFHYVDQGFMVAAGGYTADLQSQAVRTEIRNESYNKLSNKRGTVAMARHPEYPDSATSQFFINLADNTHLDYQEGETPVDGYCVFGEVIGGMDVVQSIAGVAVHDQENFAKLPIEPVTIQSVERAY